MSNVVEVLKQDHRTVEGLFAQFESSRDPSVAEQICSELDAHAGAEEHAVYPAIREGVSGGEKMVDHAQGEHAEARQLIGRIRQTKDPDHLAELVTALKGGIQDHVSEEEGEVFPKMEAELDAVRLDDLGDEVERFKAEA